MRLSADTEIEPLYAVLDGNQQKLYVLRKSYQYLKNTICCVPRARRKIDAGLAIYTSNDPSSPVGAIVNSEITVGTEMNPIEKTLLFAALICIVSYILLLPVVLGIFTVKCRIEKKLCAFLLQPLFRKTTPWIMEPVYLDPATE